MKRNRSGMNLDEGVALTSQEEFELLYLETESEIETRLANWINHGNGSIIFGGQIGCGKTTAIERAIRLADKQPDITCHFDRNHINPSPLDTWLILFAEIARFSANNDLKVIANILPGIQAILGDNPQQWDESLAQVLLTTYSPSALEKHREFKAILAPLLDNLPAALRTVIQEHEKKLGRSLFILASGVDKFEPSTSAYISLSEPLAALSSFKTLYEVNAVHLFSRDAWTRNSEQLVLTATNQDWIENMLKKRLGIYAQACQKEISLLAAFSGGLPRQALRLLDHFVIEHKNHPDQNDAIIHSVANVNRDFFAFAKRPENSLLNAVNKKKLLETTLISLPGDADTAMRAVFGNWIILQKQQQESRWQACINPAITDSLELPNPDGPEMLLLKQYARRQDISATGLDIDVQATNWHSLLHEEIEHPHPLNILEILDTISAALLSKQREDRIIIAYEDRNNAEYVRAYLQAKSNSYEYQTWGHKVIHGGNGKEPINEILDFLSDKSIDIYSMEFVGDYTNEQLNEINIRRDTLINKQIIWWIPKNELARYLIEWTQLRQLFQIFIMEDDISKALSIEDIEADIEFMQDLSTTEETAEFNYVKNLNKVLNYLKEKKNG